MVQQHTLNALGVDLVFTVDPVTALVSVELDARSISNIRAAGKATDTYILSQSSSIPDSTAAALQSLGADAPMELLRDMQDRAWFFKYEYPGGLVNRSVEKCMRTRSTVFHTYMKFKERHGWKIAALDIEDGRRLWNHLSKKQNHVPIAH